MNCNFCFLEHSVQSPTQFCICWDFARAELSGMITLCVIYYIVRSSLWSLPLFSAYTVVSYSMFNFLPSLDFSFQSVVWFVFCLIDFRLILQDPFLVLFLSFKALCHFTQADVTAKLCQCTHMPSPRLLMDAGYKTVPRMTYCGTPPAKSSQSDNKPSITALWEQFYKCCAPTGLLLISGMHWHGLLSKMLCGTMSKACHCHDASYLLFALICQSNYPAREWD